MDYAIFIQDLKEAFLSQGFNSISDETLKDHSIDMAMNREKKGLIFNEKYILFVTCKEHAGEETVTRFLKSISDYITKKYTENSTAADFLFDLKLFRRGLRFFVIPVIVTEKISNETANWINCTPVSLYYGSYNIKPFSYHNNYLMNSLPVIYSLEDSTVNYDRIAPDINLERIVKKAFLPKIGHLINVTKRQLKEGKENKVFLEKKIRTSLGVILTGIICIIFGWMASIITSGVLWVFFTGAGLLFIITGLIGLFEVYMRRYASQPHQEKK